MEKFPLRRIILFFFAFGVSEERRFTEAINEREELVMLCMWRVCVSEWISKTLRALSNWEERKKAWNAELISKMSEEFLF